MTSRWPNRLRLSSGWYGNEYWLWGNWVFLLSIKSTSFSVWGRSLMTFCGQFNLRIKKGWLNAINCPQPKWREGALANLAVADHIHQVHGDCRRVAYRELNNEEWTSPLDDLMLTVKTIVGLTLNQAHDYLKRNYGVRVIWILWFWSDFSLTGTFTSRIPSR